MKLKTKALKQIDASQKLLIDETNTLDSELRTLVRKAGGSFVSGKASVLRGLLEKQEYEGVHDFIESTDPESFLDSGQPSDPATILSLLHFLVANVEIDRPRYFHWMTLILLDLDTCIPMVRFYAKGIAGSIVDIPDVPKETFHIARSIAADLKE